MIFYTAVDEQGRTHWEKTQADARAINKKFEQVDVPVDKPGLHVWLNAMQQQLDRIPAMDNQLWALKVAGLGSDEAGGLQDPPNPDPYAHADGSRECRPAEPLPKPEGYTERAVRFEDEFANMSLSLQLHYAALAMENARERL